MADRITPALGAHRALASHLTEARVLLAGAAHGDHLGAAALGARAWIEDEIAALATTARQAEAAMEPVLAHLARADQVARQRATTPVGAG